MTAAILRFSLAALASMSVAAYGQGNVAMAPSTGPPVHPGTAILDSMGIFAGQPVPDAPNGNAVAVTTVIPK